MRIPGRNVLREAGLRLRRRLSPGAVVLGYHRIAEPVDDPYDLCVSPENFAQQLEIVRELANPLSLADLVGRAAIGELPERALAITFDDGYSDIQQMALPLLRQAEVPATVFVVSGMLGGEFWWDRLGEAFRLGGRPPSEHDHASTLESMQLELRVLPASERDRLLLALETSGSAVATMLPRCVTVDELRTLAAEPLIEIGGHTGTHPWLPSLNADQLRREIRNSRQELRNIVASPVAGFSYPYGGVSADVREEVRAAGYTFACGSNNGVVTAGSDRFAVPRFWVGDLDGDAFARWLKRWLHV
jgi:peptidoglycan/xylan/chitin deacetylase (PgdA/CDA1 family)